jgi:hypothetical protein
MLLITAAVCGCGSSPPAEQASAPNPWPGAESTPEPGFDPEDPALQTIPDDDASREALIRRIGDRPDFKVPRRLLANLQDGPLVLTVAIRPFMELAGREDEISRLNEGQRAVYAMYVADFEIGNGGFAQLWTNSSGTVARYLVPAAERVGSREFTQLYRDAEAAWPGRRIPDDASRREELVDQMPADRLDALDRRWTATQYRRKTALAVVLAPYIRAHLDEFAYG